MDADPGIDLAGTRALVTGGTSGLGLAMASALARAGAAVALTSRSPDRAAAAAARLPGAIGIAADARDEADAARAVDQAWTRLGGIDLLVNNAGLGMITVNPRFMTEPMGFWQVPPAGFRAVLETNLTGYFLMAREVVPRMLAAGSGRIVNISMNHTTMNRRGFSPYGPARAGAEALSRIMAADLRETPVRVNLLLPGGATETGMLPPAPDRPERLHLIDPAVMGPPILWLASPQARDVHDERIVAIDFGAGQQRGRLQSPGALGREQRDRGDLLLGQILPADTGRGPGAVPGPAVDDPLGCDNQVDRHIVVGERDGPGRADLQLVHGGDADRMRADQPGRGGQRELQVGEPAALAQPGPVLPGRDAAHHHQVDRGHLRQRHPAGRAGRAADRGGLTRRLAEVVGVQGEERLRLGQPRHRHVDDLAVFQRPLAHRPLRRVRVGLDGPGRLPGRQPAQPFGRGLGPSEVRDPPGRAREPGHLGRAHGRPDLLAQFGLGGQQFGRAAGVAIMAWCGSGHALPP
jgi:gluconate 5-dehydrogenase